MVVFGAAAADAADVPPPIPLPLGLLLRNPNNETARRLALGAVPGVRAPSAARLSCTCSQRIHTQLRPDQYKAEFLPFSSSSFSFFFFFFPLLHIPVRCIAKRKVGGGENEPTRITDRKCIDRQFLCQNINKRQNDSSNG